MQSGNSIPWKTGARGAADWGARHQLLAACRSLLIPPRHIPHMNFFFWLNRNSNGKSGTLVDFAINRNRPTMAFDNAV